MKNFSTYKRVIAIKERSAGNETIGDRWVETKSFDSEDTLEEVLEWALDCSGRLIITVDETGAGTETKGRKNA